MDGKLPLVEPCFLKCSSHFFECLGSFDTSGMLYVMLDPYPIMSLVGQISFKLLGLFNVVCFLSVTPEDVKDTADFLAKLQIFTTCHLTLYLLHLMSHRYNTNIPHNEGTEACQVPLNLRDVLELPTN